MNDQIPNYEKSLEWMKDVEPQDNWTEDDWNHYQTVKAALKKQIPKPPRDKVVMNKERKEVDGECPGCLKVVNSLWNPKRCGECGQALDWKN